MLSPEDLEGPRDPQCAEDLPPPIEELLPPGFCVECQAYAVLPNHCDQCGGELTGTPSALSPTGDKCIDCAQRGEVTLADVFLIKQRVGKCIPCFLIAAMRAPCFQCENRPTEVIVRAIAIDGRNDAVGVCMNCLQAHISTQRN